MNYALPAADGGRRAAVVQAPGLSLTGALEHLFARLFSGLVYAQIWEDPLVDMAALAITPEDDVFCIASGGCNAMSYLTASPRSLTAVDLSPAHVALLRLKLTAAQVLQADDFWRFFGEADRPGNCALYDGEIRNWLDFETLRYWDGLTLRGRRINLFTRGVHRHGLLGRFIGAAHLLARTQRIDFRPLLAARSQAEQSAWFDAHLAPLFDRPLVRRLARGRATLFGLGIPPAQYDKLAADAGGDILPVLKARLRKLVCDFPISDNYFAWQAFARRYDRSETRSVPPCLAAQNFPAMAAAAPRARVFNLPMTEVLAGEPAGSKSCYSLLDAQDWMSDAQLNALWAEIDRTARPGARVIFRTGGCADILPGRLAPAIAAGWERDEAASATGSRNDRSAVYGAFHVYRKT